MSGRIEPLDTVVDNLLDVGIDSVTAEDLKKAIEQQTAKCLKRITNKDVCIMTVMALTSLQMLKMAQKRSTDVEPVSTTIGVSDEGMRTWLNSVQEAVTNTSTLSYNSIKK